MVEAISQPPSTPSSTRLWAAEIIGVTDRTMRRWRDRLEKGGYAGLADRRKGKPSAQRIPLATAEKVLGLYQETYYDLNIRHFHEKLRDEHGGMRYSPSALVTALKTKFVAT